MNTKGTPDSMNNNVRSKAEDISINGQDSVHESLNKEGSLNYVVLAAYLVVFILVAFYTVSRGNPAKLVHPSNSKGELCGHQNQTGKPNLLYFDITKCTGLAASDGGCATPQVCVKECPNTYWTSSQGKPTGLDQFCEDLPVGNTADMMSLVEDRLCPAYLLPSMPVLGRCVPVVGMGSQEEAAKRADKMNAMKTDDGKVLNMDTLVRGIGYVKDGIDARSQHEKLFALIYVYWWILLVSFLLAIICSLTFTVIIKIAGTTVLWINQALCLAVLVACMVFSFMMYRHMMIGRQEEISSASMSSYMFNKIFWLACGIILTVTTFSIFIFDVLYFQSITIAIKHISEGSKSISYGKMVFLPIIKSLLHVLIITCSIMVSVFLATTGSEEFRVVESCSSETCFNNASKKIFSLYDICDPTTFGDCTGCPRAQCVFHQFGPDTLASWLHFFNWAGMVWLLFLVQSCQDLKKTGSGLNITCAGMLAKIKTSFIESCHKPSWKSLQSFLICHSDVRGDNCWVEIYRNLFRITDRKIVMRRVIGIIIFSTKLSFTGTVTIITLAFVSAVNISYDFHLNYHVGPFFILILGTYLITSAFLEIYNSEDVLLSQFHESIQRKDFELQNIIVVEENEILFDVNRNVSKLYEGHGSN